jgi:hypothetical protein
VGVQNLPTGLIPPDVPAENVKAEPSVPLAQNSSQPASPAGGAQATSGSNNEVEVFRFPQIPVNQEEMQPK